MMLLAFVSLIICALRKKNPCLSYIILDDYSRSVTLHGNSRKCDSLDTKKYHKRWVRMMVDSYDATIPYNYVTPMYSCGSLATGWIYDPLNRGLPVMYNRSVHYQVCYHWNEHCKWHTDIEIAKCVGDFYIVLWNPHRYKCHLRFCAEVNKPERIIKCYEYDRFDKNVCNGNGICIENNVCKCNVGYEGKTCNLINRRESKFLKHKNIESSRLFCDNKNSKLCNRNDNNNIIDNLSDLGDLFGKTIRDVCINYYYGFAIDSDGELFIWGKENDYHVTHSSKPILFHPNIIGQVKKIGCSNTSLVLLTFSNIFYSMGMNKDHELLTGQSNHFLRNYDDVFDFEIGIDSLFITLNSNIGNRNIIKAIGRNSFGQLAINSNDSVISTYCDVYLDDFPDSIELPRIKIFHNGVVFKFPENRKYYFAGKMHPTLNEDTIIPKIISFDDNWEDNAIDFIDRPIDSEILFIISRNSIYSFGFYNNSINEIDNSIYGDFLKLSDRLIIDFTCSYSCFLLTKESLFVYGESSGWNCTNDCDKRFWTISNDILFVTPRIGTNDFWGLFKPLHIKTYNILFDNQFPVEFDFERSKMIDSNHLEIVIKKPEVFLALEPVIQFGIGENDSLCKYEGNGKYKNADNLIWNFYNLDGYDYYTATLNLLMCGWQQVKKVSTKVYYNRIFFKELFFLEYVNTKVFSRSEDYSLDIAINVKNKVVISIDLNIEKIFSILSSGTSISIYEKTFNRNTKQGRLKLLAKNEKSILFVNPRFVWVSNSYNFLVYPIIREILELRECSNKICYQTFELEYIVHPDLCLISCDFIIDTDIDCNEQYNVNNEFCLPVKSGLEFIVKILSENICSEFQQLIEIEGNMKAFKDWRFEEESYIFHKNDVIYFTNEVVTVGDTSTITSSEISEIIFNDEFVFYTNKHHTQIGIDSNLIIDKLLSSNVLTGFHFQLKNDLLMKNKYQYKISVKVEVMFLGNEVQEKRIVNPIIDNNAEKFSSETSKLSIQIIPSINSIKSVMIVTAVMIFGILFFLLFILSILILIIVINYKDLLYKKKQKSKSSSLK